MALSGFRLKFLRASGKIPSTSKMEARRKAMMDDYQRFTAYRESPQMKRYSELEALLTSSNDAMDPKELKEQRKEFRAIEKSSDYKWFRKQQKRETFQDVEAEEVLFFDDFDTGRLEPSKWIPRFFWGEATIGQAYSFVGDPHCYTDGNNVMVQDSIAKIITRPQQAEGLAWDSKLGFIPYKFRCTSGVITTGHAFRMSRGLFEAKIRCTAEPGVYHSFYLVGDRRLPQVDVFRARGDKAGSLAGMITMAADLDPEMERIIGLPFSREFFILSVRVTKDKIEWMINGFPYMEQVNVLSDKSLYLVFASAVEPEAELTGESTLEIDWVRCTAPTHP